VSPSKKSLIESVFAGDSDMAARMRAFDWSKTDLGPVEQWSQSLRAGVRIMLGSGHPMLISWGPDYTMLYNDAYGVVVGSKHPSALGRSCREVLAEAWDYIGPRFDAVYQEGRSISTLSHQMFTFHRRNYLEECYFAFSYSPVPDDDGDVGGVLTSALDLTDRVVEDRRKQVLRDLASRVAQARNEEEVWRVSSATLAQNPTSAPFALLYEYQPTMQEARLAGLSLISNDALHPQVIDCSTENFWGLYKSLTEDCLVVPLGEHASGLSIPGWPTPLRDATVLPIRLSERGEAAGFLVLGIHPGRAFDENYRHFVHRIAEQIAIGLATARAYEEERRRAEALAEIDRAKTAFFSNVSHEFRTPLTLMLGPLEEVLTEAHERLSPAGHEQLITIRRNAVRLLRLVNTLLDFSRIEAGRVQAVYEPTDLARFTSEVASVFRSAMERAGLRFSVECQPIAQPVYVDRDMWDKVVSNLLSNAFKFTFEGVVAVTLKPANDAVELQVRDTGVGIPADQRERVFERFHRIEGTQARTYEGSGIGLALVQELVKLHGGSVRVDSVLGQGSKFTVTIPRGTAHLPADRIQAARSMTSTAIGAKVYAEEAERWLPDERGAEITPAPLPTMDTLGRSSPAQSPAHRELIVVADDNADMRQYLRHLLEDRYHVESVADGQQALEATRRLRPALVLADVMMPRLDGFALLRAIRDDMAVASVPVILLSARAGEESRVEGLQAGADDYLVKPFTSRELLARVEAHLKLASQRREATEREERLRGEAELEHEKLRASQELRELQEELAHANRMATMGQLAASIAHEVNQPIGAARNNAHAALRFLASQKPDLAEVTEALESVVSETYRAGDIISRIRDQVRKAPPQMSRVDLNDAIEEVITLVRGELSKSRVSIRLQLGAGLSPGHGDRVQLQQVVLNLILNAIEAMVSVEDGARELVISTEASLPDDLLVAIGDSGPGVAAEDRERVFDSFYTTKVGGVGIGLSICRSIVDAHGGRLWAEAHEPRGAIFRFTLPAHH
jgi:signal transduction histidine kinase